jgi:hypothetical protein
VASAAAQILYAQTAKVEAKFDSACEKRATELAKAALETIHRFCNRITDPLIQLELQDGAAELEKFYAQRNFDGASRALRCGNGQGLARVEARKR